jgi:glycosyltransferase involved in cell wall biosynthesis
MRYLVIIPALNEEASISKIVQDIRVNMPSADILVVNDGSSDRTALMARESGARVIHHPFNIGYGAALQTGFRVAERMAYDVVITMDGDGQHDALSLQALVRTMKERDADIVIGSRFLEHNVRTSLPKKIGVMLFSFIGKVYTRTIITDPTSGFQLMKRDAFSYLSKEDNYPTDYPDVNMIMLLHKMRYRVVEVPVAMNPSVTVKSMHSGLRPFLYVTKMFLAIIMVLVRKEGK